MAQVLIVEDSPEQASLLAGLVEAAGFDVEVVADGESALEALALRTPDIVATDLMLPGITGLDVVDAVKRDYPLTPVVLMTAFGSGEIAARARLIRERLQTLQRSAARLLRGSDCLGSLAIPA